MCRKLARHKNAQAGFTLLELVVVVGVIGIVLSVLTLGIRRASDAFSLRRAAIVAISEVRRAHAAEVSEAASYYMVEFVLGNPGSLNVYRSTATAQTCPAGMDPKPPTTTTLCTKTVAGQEWPSSVAVNGPPGTTLAACTAPASSANKCVTFRPLGYADVGGVVQLQNQSGVTLNVQVTAATGRVSVQP